MLPTSSFQDQLSNYRETFLQPKSSPSARFEALRKLYESYVKDAENRSIMIYGTSLLQAERHYDGLKGTCKAQHQQLKQMQKNLDERTLAIEQQLYLGLPNDLKEMDKVIGEQESILEDQQKINQTEEELLEKMRRIDIEHGKKLASVELAASERSHPISVAKEAFFRKINEEEKKAAKKTRIFALLPVVIIPIVLDLLAELVGIQSASERHFIFSHYFFFASFIILEVFFSGKIKNSIANSNSTTSVIGLLADLEKTWAENQNHIQKMEKDFGISVQEVITSLDVQADEFSAN